MGGIGSSLIRTSEWIEALLWSATWCGILVAWALWGSARLLAVWTAWTRSAHRQKANGNRVALQAAHLLLAAMLVFPSLAGAQGWWGGPPAGPGFDRNTVIQVTGKATHVNLRSQHGPATLQLQASGETYTVMLGPAWYAMDLHLDIQEGDPLAVEGSKLMDRRGNLHLVAARVTNRRTGSVVELRDEKGQPRWRDARP
ncbi:MAG TPA: hypothetical protein VF579_06680 [Candidatus Methylomirabilis sp.]